MNVMNQMLYVTTGMDTAFTPQAQPQAAQDSEPNKFESVMRDKHQEAAGKAEQKEPADEAEPKAAPEGEPAAKDEEIPEDQYVLAAALTMQPRPEITYVQPEQAVTEQPVVEAAPELAAPVETVAQPELAAEAAPVTVEEAPIETAAAPVAREAVEVPTVRKAAPEQQKAEAPEAERPVERPVELEQTSERPQMERKPKEEEHSETKPEVKLEAKPQTRTVRREDDSEETPEVEGTWNEPVFKEVDAMPVKVAAPEKPVDLEKPEAPQQIGRKLLEAIEEGKEQLQIRLTPEGLGEINITITRLETGALSVVLRAADPRAATLLQQHTNGMHDAVAGAVRGEVQIEVRASENSQQQQFLNPDGEHGRQQQQQRQQREEQDQGNDDFMQKLRLGLTDLTQTV